MKFILSGMKMHRKPAEDYCTNDWPGKSLFTLRKLKWRFHKRLAAFKKMTKVVRFLVVELIPKYAGPSSVTNCERSFEESLISGGAALNAFQQVTLESKGLYKTS